MYFMGIKGVGMATLAVMAKESGLRVTGSDIFEEFITDKILKDAGIEVLLGFEAKNVDNFFEGTESHECLFIATGAHNGYDNPESIRARELGIKVISHGEAVGLFMSGEPFGRSDFEGISVTGAHGKTTVSAMLATVLSAAGTDPSYTIGTSEVNPLGPAGHYGRGRYFVAEADEYLSEPHYDRTPKFLYQKPVALLINNIDFDHPDFYSNIDAVKNAYLDFASIVPTDGVIVSNGDDENTREVMARLGTGVRQITFGTGEKNDFILSNFFQDGLKSNFSLRRNDILLGRFSLLVPGYHNAKNAAGVIALAMELGIGVDKITQGLAEFEGTRRRMEVMGKTAAGQIIIDDYAHHPEEIRKTLSALKSAYPDQKIVTIFQFHTFSRTKALFSEFASAFSDANEVIILPTFASQRGETDTEDIDQKMVDAMKKIDKRVSLINSHESVVEYINKNFPNPDILVVVMGAGDVYKIGEALVNKQ